MQTKMDQEIDKCLVRNRHMVIWTSMMSSLERPFGRQLTRSPLLRYYWHGHAFSLLAISIRLLVFFLLDCDHSQLRLYLCDWTVLYPASRRPQILRSSLIVCAISIFIHINNIVPRKFSPAILDFVSQDPRAMFCSPLSDVGGNFNKQQQQQRQDSLLDYDQNSGYVDDFASDSSSNGDGDDDDDTYELLQVNLKTSSSGTTSWLDWLCNLLRQLIAASRQSLDTQQAGYSPSTTSKPRLVVQLDSWLSISQHLLWVRASFRVILLALVACTVWFELQHFGSEFNHVHRDCDRYGPHLPVFALMDANFINIDSCITIIGLAFQGVLVNIYIHKLIVLTKEQLLLTLGRADRGAIALASRQRANTRFDTSLAPAVSKCIDATPLGASLLSVYSESPVSSPSRHYINLAAPKSNKFELDPDPELPPVGAETTFSVSTTGRQRAATTATATTATSPELIRVRQLVIDMLQAIDEQKSLVSFIGAVLYFWLISGSLFVAFSILASRSLSQQTPDVVAFPVIMGLVLASCIAFAILSSNINKQVSLLVSAFVGFKKKSLNTN